MNRCTKVHAKNLVRWAKDKPDVLALSADLTSSTELDLFRDAYPGRFVSMGIAEQNMMSFAGGLAREGFFPFVHTFAVFIYRRAYDQIAMSISYPNLPVRMFGFLPGVTTPGGATHQAIEDVAIMRALPNMTILECGDATDVETVLDAAHAVRGPVYVRMLRGEIPRLFPENEPLTLNTARKLGEGGDITLLSSGICTEEAMRATPVLRKKGVSIKHLHVSTLKPFNDPAVAQAIASAKYGVITMENHSVLGGLGTCAAEIIAGGGMGKKLVKIGLQDTYVHGASRAYLMKEYNLDAMALVGAVERMMATPLNITADEIAASPPVPQHSDARPEAL